MKRNTFPQPISSIFECFNQKKLEWFLAFKMQYPFHKYMQDNSSYSCSTQRKGLWIKISHSRSVARVLLSAGQDWNIFLNFSAFFLPFFPSHIGPPRERLAHSGLPCLCVSTPQIMALSTANYQQISGWIKRIETPWVTGLLTYWIDKEPPHEAGIYYYLITIRGIL